jgi:hypothetical protein
VLIVAAGVSFYYAKKEIDVRRRDQQLRGARPTEKLSCEPYLPGSPCDSSEI